MKGCRYIMVHEVILDEEKKMNQKFSQIPVNGRRTQPQTIKQVKQIISNTTFRIARKCNVSVNYPNMMIQGKEVVLGKPSILLPNLQYVDFDELKRIELGYKK